MPIAVAFLVIASAVVHAWWNALLKRTRAPGDAVIAITLFAALTAAIVAVGLAPTLPSRRALVICLGSGVLMAAYFASLARALSLAPLGPVYTIVRGGALVLVWPVSVLLLGEHLTWGRAGGTIFVLIGLCVTGAAQHRAETSRVHWRGFAIAALCACFTASYQLAHKVVLEEGAHPAHVVAIALGSAAAINIVLLGRKRVENILEATREQPVNVIGGGVLCGIGFLLFLSGMGHEGAGAVLTLRNTSILFAQLFASLMGDRPNRLGFAGAMSVFAGAALLAV
jgi:drug/metabolite transporter (DMT)-like permease